MREVTVSFGKNKGKLLRELDSAYLQWMQRTLEPRWANLAADVLAQRNAPQHILGFGKHKGKALDEVPEDYLRWLAHKMKGEELGSLAHDALHRGRPHGTSPSLQPKDHPDPSPPEASFAGGVNECIKLLRECTDLAEARGLRSRLLASGPLLEKNRNFLSNLMLLMFGKCGSVEEARAIFDGMAPNSFSWNTMLKVYLDCGCWGDADAIFKQMPEGVANVISCTAMVSMYTLQGRVEDAKAAFDHIPPADVDAAAWNALISCYAKNSCLDEAVECFMGMQGRDVVSWNALVAAFARNGHLAEVDLFFWRMPMWDGFSWNIVAAGEEEQDKKKERFDGMPGRSIVSFNSLLASCVDVDDLEGAISVFETMPGWSVVSFNAMVKAYAQRGEVHESKLIFDSVIEGRDCLLWTSLVHAYASNGCSREARDVFDKMPQYDTVSFISVSGVYSREGAFSEAQRLFESVGERSIQLWTSLLSASVNEQRFDAAERIFNLMPQWDVASCTTAMAALLGNVPALEKLFKVMQQRNAASWTVLLGAYAQDGQMDRVEAVMAKVPMMDVLMENVILASYVNNSSVEDAVAFFTRMHERNVVSWTLAVAANARKGQMHESLGILTKSPAWDAALWNTVFAGYSRDGDVAKSMELLQWMNLEGIPPNETSFVCLLDGFSHVAKVEDGRRCFASISADYDIETSERHYTCMVDMLGRAGRLDAAEELVGSMPFVANMVTWHALLGACRNHGDSSKAERAGKKALELEPSSASTYVLLANTQSRSGGNCDGNAIKSVMKKKGAKRMAGISRVKVNGKLHRFAVGDTSHPKSDEIYKELSRLNSMMKEAGYVPDTSVTLLDEGASVKEKEDLLCRHSEKLALAFAMISTPQESVIEITKNLRMCYDCHDATRFISKITGRSIVVADANRIHRFTFGACSCGNLW